MKHLFKLVFVLLIVSSCDDIVEVEDISNSLVTILAPTNAVTLNTTSVSFSWNSVEDAESYRLQIAKPNFENALEIVLDTIITNTSFTKELEENTSYQWRVRAENSGYQTAYATQNLTISTVDAIDISNETVSLLAPANAVVFGPMDTINFSWESIADASSYVIQIARPNFANAIEIIEDVTQAGTSFSVNNLAVNDYEWRVRAQNNNYQTVFTTQSFSVE